MSPALRPEGTDDSIFNIDIQYSRVTKGLVNEDDFGRSVCQPWQLSETDYLIKSKVLLLTSISSKDRNPSGPAA